MKIFKFGGASTKDAQSIKNIVHILKKEGTTSCLLVVSAMGKMTNAFENIVNAYVNNNSEKVSKSIDFVTKFHIRICNNLFPTNNVVHQKLNVFIGEMIRFLEENKSNNYDYLYDQIVCFGELISTTILNSYLNYIGIENNWMDVRNLIKTDSNYRDATVNWKETADLINAKIDRSKLNVVQGFIGRDAEGFTTTLGREGSDYTAGIFAYCLEANAVTIWKDVQGVLNGDPKVSNDTHLLKQISYEETIEMAFYGASVIHPKTIQPLQRKGIPLHVRSFIDANSKGTIISSGAIINPVVPCFIVKKNQVLISISTKDFSFMVENNISDIFKLLHHYRLSVNLIQNSAISFSVCVDNKFNHFDHFFERLQSSFKVSFKKGIDLYTVRHFTNDSLKNIYNLGNPLLTQINKETAQIIIQKK